MQNLLTQLDEKQIMLRKSIPNDNVTTNNEEEPTTAFLRQNASPLSSSASSPFTAVRVRPMQSRDVEQVARIWRDGLQQTIDALCTGIFTMLRPLAEYMTNLAAQVALSPHGDIGPRGSNLLQRWSESSNEDRCMFVVVVVIAEASPQNTTMRNVDKHGNVEERVVGCIGVKRGMGEHHADPTSPWASIWRMSVDARCRRCGLGTRLMEAAEEWARSKSCDAMILVTINPLAAIFYRQQGYQPARFRWFHYTKALAKEA